MTTSFIDLKPTSINQWQSLVTEASNACDIKLTEDIESYLVFLLMRFTGSPQLAQKIMATELLESVNQKASLRSITLRDVGDQCLLYSGLFPGRAHRRRVRLSYYVNIGKSAYLSLSNLDRFTDTVLFASLAEQFVSLMDILCSMRETNSQIAALDPLQAHEIWSDTGSKHALQTLKKYNISPATAIFNLLLPKNIH
jgi:hypothetical protein